MTSVRRAWFLLVLIAASGCMRWRQVRTLPSAEEGPVSFRAARVTAAQPASPIRLSPPVVLHGVQVTADSVIGWRDGAAARVAFPRDRVRVLEARRIDLRGTVGVTTLVIVVAYGAAVWYALSHY